MQWVAIKRCVCLLVKRTVNDFDSSDEKRAFIYDSLGLLAGLDLSRVTSYRRGLSLFFLFPLFFVIVGSIVVLLSLYCRFIVFYCRSTVILLSFHGRSIVNLLVVLCFPLLFFVFLGFAFFIFVFCLCLSFVKSRYHSRYHRFVIIGRYRSDVITLSLSCRFYRVFLCRFSLTFFLEFLVVFLDCGWYVGSYCVTGFIIVIIVLLFLLGCECLVAFGG